MRIGLFPVMKREAFSQQEFIVNGLDYFTAFDLAHVGGYLAQFCPGHEVFLEVDPQSLVRHYPDVVILWCSTSGFGQAMQVATMVKQQLGIPLILGGPHISNYPTSLPTVIDIGVLGEAEVAIGELMQIFAKDLRANPLKYARVAGIVYQNRGRTFMGPTAKVVKDIDKLPPPRQELFFDIPNSYWAPVIMTSRGSCQLDLAPYAYTLQSDKNLRFHSPERVISEMKAVAALYARRYQGYSFIPTKNVAPVIIGDPSFLSQPERLEKIVRLAQAEGIPEKVFFIVMAHYADLNDRVCALLAELNVHAITLYFETISPALTKSRKRPNTLQQLDLAINACRRHHLDVAGCYQVNTTLEASRQDIFRTYWFLKSRSHLFVRCEAIYMPPFPGSEQWNRFLQSQPGKQIDPANFPWHLMNFNFQADTPFASTQMDRASFAEVFAAVKDMCGRVEPFYRYAIGFKTEQSKSFIYTFAIFEKLFPPGTTRILDICHFGPLCLRHAPYADKYTITHAPIVNCKLTPVEGLHDAAVIYTGLERVRDAEQLLQQVSEHLKPGGVLVLSLINPLSVPFLLNILLLPRTEASNYALKFYSEKTISQLLEKTGFEMNKPYYNIINMEPYKNFLQGFIPLMQHMGGLALPEDQFQVLELIIVATRKDTNVRTISPANAGKIKNPD